MKTTIPGTDWWFKHSQEKPLAHLSAAVPVPWWFRQNSECRFYSVTNITKSQTVKKQKSLCKSNYTSALIQACFHISKVFFSTVRPEANAPISRNVVVPGSSSPYGGCSHQEHSSLALHGLCSGAVWGLTHADEMNAWPVLTEVSLAAGPRTSPRKVRAAAERQPPESAGRGEPESSELQQLSGSAEHEMWFLSLFCSTVPLWKSAGMSACCSLRPPSWWHTMLLLHLWLQQQEAAQGWDEDLLAVAPRGPTGWAALKSCRWNRGIVIFRAAWGGAVATRSVCGTWERHYGSIFLVSFLLNKHDRKTHCKISSETPPCGLIIKDWIKQLSESLFPIQ